MRRNRWVLPALAVLAALVLVPHAAYAWTPGTHVFLGDAVMRSLDLIPSGIGDLLRAFPYDFLYGSIAADTSFAKKYAPVGRHCHSWQVGFEIHEAARDEPRRAFAVGYLTHLAADTIAHNYFVPRQLAVTSSTSGLGHSYWESRFETHLGEGWSRKARDLILLDHGESDALLDRVLSPTIFSTRTNRRIFRGMVHAADSDSWQRIFQLMMENSRWDLRDGDVSQYLVRSFDYIIDLLREMDHSRIMRFDPSGEEPLARAKQIRRDALRAGGEPMLWAEAERHFGLPTEPSPYASQVVEPIYVPRERSPSN